MAKRQRRTDVRFDSWAGAGEGGLVVYDPRTDEGHLLNPATAVVFEACDGSTSVADMGRLMTARTGLPADEGIVGLALAELDQVGLLNPIEGASVAGGEDAGAAVGMSRRALITRLALGAGAVALLPAIGTVVGSSQLAAAAPAAPQADIPTLVAGDKTATTMVDTPVDVTFTTTGGFTTPTSTVFSIATGPTHGTATVADGVATYTPAAGFVGTDTFTYIAAQCIPFSDALPACPDGTGPFPDVGSEPATVTVTVTPAPTTTAAPTTAPPAAAEAATAQPTFTG